MKQQDNPSPSKASSTTKDLNCVEKDISNNEFQKATVKMINDLKEEKKS
jgi:hypothetical protein